MELEVCSSIGDIPALTWQEWFGTDYPFLRHDFLLGLETAGCTTAKTGWRPSHLILRDKEQVIAAAPAFLKSHSYGEYVFDWAWADAWQRHGLDYYPKLLTATPFTPASGPRLWLNPNVDDALDKLLAAVAQFCKDHGVSGWHLLFVESELSKALSTRGLHQRMTTQFHWFNRGYQSFDDFLDLFSSRKRKNLRKERSRVVEQGLSLTTKTGSDINAADWSFFHHCYQMTYAKRSGHGGYLSREFFTEVCPALGETPVMVIASHSEQPVAAALYFRSSSTLYGRYWGCLREYDYLHFEACYYRGIEYCIEQGLQRFDPGAQGEHKIQRGFEPILTRSSHWIVEGGFNDALTNFCQRECDHVAQYRQEACSLLPFKEGVNTTAY